jgi:hypothetical protein
LAGHLVRIDDGSAFGNVDVSLFDLGRLRTVDLVRADSSGSFQFSGIGAGTYVPVVHLDGGSVFHLPASRWSFTASERYELAIPIRSVPPLEDQGVQLHGRIVDDVTGLPVVFAHVEMDALALLGRAVRFSELAGEASSLEPTTDRDGRFTIAPVPLLQGDADPEPMVPSWRVWHPDYHPLTVSSLPATQAPESVTVRLVPGREARALAGRVLDRAGAPLPGVDVAVEWTQGPGTAAQKSDAPVDQGGGGGLHVTQFVATSAATDADGRYRIDGLPAGSFIVRAAPVGDDGWIQNIPRVVDVAASDTLVALPDLIVVPTVEALQPPDLAEVALPPDLYWTEVPGASEYRVFVLRAIDGRGATATFPSPPAWTNDPFFDPDTMYEWEIRAVDSGGVTLALSERRRAFVLKRAPGATPGPASDAATWVVQP